MVAPPEALSSLAREMCVWLESIGEKMFRCEGGVLMAVEGRLVRYSVTTPYLRIEEVAVHCDLHPELIERFVHLGLIDPVGRDQRDDALLFDEAVIPLVKKIIRLRNDLGINYAGIGVVLDLLDRLDAIERRVQVLEEKMARLIVEE